MCFQVEGLDREVFFANLNKAGALQAVRIVLESHVKFPVSLQLCFEVSTKIHKLKEIINIDSKIERAGQRKEV